MSYDRIDWADAHEQARELVKGKPFTGEGLLNDFRTWLSFASSLKSTGYINGFELFHELSRASLSYKSESECRKFWEYARLTRADASGLGVVDVNASKAVKVLKQLGVHFKLIRDEATISQQQKNVSSWRRRQLPVKEINEETSYRYISNYKQSQLFAALLAKCWSTPYEQHVQDVFKLYRVGASENAAVFTGFDAEGRQCWQKFQWYLSNGHRDKLRPPRTIGAFTCFFGEHLLSQKENAGKTLVVVESEKTALLGAMKAKASSDWSNLLFIATAGAFNLERIADKLNGRDVILSCDNDAAGQSWKAIAAAHGWRCTGNEGMAEHEDLGDLIMQEIHDWKRGERVMLWHLLQSSKEFKQLYETFKLELK